MVRPPKAPKKNPVNVHPLTAGKIGKTDTPAGPQETGRVWKVKSGLANKKTTPTTTGGAVQVPKKIWAKSAVSQGGGGGTGVKNVTLVRPPSGEESQLGGEQKCATAPGNEVEENRVGGVGGEREKGHWTAQGQGKKKKGESQKKTHRG